MNKDSSQEKAQTDSQSVRQKGCLSQVKRYHLHQLMVDLEDAKSGRRHRKNKTFKDNL